MKTESQFTPRSTFRDLYQQIVLHQRAFDLKSSNALEAAFRQLLLIDFSNEKEIIQLHEFLLFSLAYPANKTIHDLAESLMKKLVQTVTEWVQNNPDRFYNSGITGSRVCARFGLLLNQYLLKEDLEVCEFAGFDELHSDMVGKLTITLDPVEQELMENDAAYPNKWQKKYLPGIKNKHDLLQFYIQAALQIKGSISYQEQMFAEFHLFTQFSLDEKLLGISNGRLKQLTHFYHKEGILKKCSIAQVFAEGKPKQIKLHAAAQAELVRLARGSMASLLRETDTFTYARVEETELFDLGRGIGVALYYMIPEQKFSLQSYVGYLLFKNGVPMAYGGCWLFGYQAAFGVNVLAPYRGGESALVVSQLLRLYHFRFGIQQFTVDPYQIGKGNSDGIKSGAFWFYYKLGFRPIQKNLALLAESEIQRMNTEKNYRSPAKTLIKLADAEIYWASETNKENYISLNKISDVISLHIVHNFLGNREKALEEARKKYQKKTQSRVAQSSFLNRLLIALDALGAMESLPTILLKKIGDAYQIKASSEAEAFMILLKIKPFWKLFSK